LASPRNDDHKLQLIPLPRAFACVATTLCRSIILPARRHALTAPYLCGQRGKTRDRFLSIAEMATFEERCIYHCHDGEHYRKNYNASHAAYLIQLHPPLMLSE
jgi:hypothetical protein